MASEPPRSITPFADLIVSAATSIHTFGRDSKIIPITPKGIRICPIFNPFGNVFMPRISPTGSLRSITSFRIFSIPSMRLSFNSSLSRKAFDNPLCIPLFRSFSLAILILSRFFSISSAIIDNALSFCSVFSFTNSREATFTLLHFNNKSSLMVFFVMKCLVMICYKMRPDFFSFKYIKDSKRIIPVCNHCVNFCLNTNFRS
ncbi:hypothetical protein ES708_24695 [subsurface metagenome]